MDRTITASPAIIQPAEGEATLFGIDRAKSVALEPQHFDASNPQHESFCLVLRLDFAGLNVNIHKFTYQVTLLFNEREGWHLRGLFNGTRPE